MKEPHVPIDDMQSAKTSSKDAAAIVEAERALIGVTITESLEPAVISLTPVRILHIHLNDARWNRLEALARMKKKSMEDCVNAFIDSCQPNGSGWTHPEKAGNPKTVKA